LAFDMFPLLPISSRLSGSDAWWGMPAVQ
jgi:hypothetical protein